ncbi:MAG: dTDP-4-dehydrorhamnose reductase [Candidatus Omnitrophica bacterium]|nr:dTDP-4-dehydrorhamnose reductase [Candidatus Omnitrophota bacterium]
MVEKLKKTVLITGAAGMLGHDLISELNTDFTVFGMDLLSLDYQGVNILKCDITNSKEVEVVFDDLKPWIVVHAAAYTNVDGCEQEPEKAKDINFTGTVNLVRCAKAHAAKFIFISTDYVFDGAKGKAYDIHDKPSPLNVYGSSKLAAEKFIRDNLKEFLIVRTSWLFGCYGNNFVRTIMEKAKTIPALYVVKDQVGSPTYTVTLSKAIKNLIESVFFKENSWKNFGIYHVSNSGSCSWYEFAKKIVELNNLPSEVIPVDSSYVKRPAKRPEFSILCNKRYEDVCGKKNPHWQQALEEYLKGINYINDR